MNNVCSRPWLPLSMLGAAIALGCAPPHIKPFVPRERNYDVGSYAADQEQAKPAQGSIYTEAMAGFLEDTRAVRVGDIVMIRIDERANARGGASTDLDRESNRNLGITSLLGLAPAIQRSHPTIDPASLIDLMSEANFSGEGQTSRDGTLSGLIAVRVKKQLPNEDLFIEGTKVVMINNEEYHLYVSGLIRPADIEGDNSVPSWRLADAQVEFTGRGDIADQVDRGWLAEILDAINPF
jgi:flagellar L-ring protein precursor FlgH